VNAKINIIVIWIIIVILPLIITQDGKLSSPLMPMMRTRHSNSSSCGIRTQRLGERGIQTVMFGVEERQCSGR